MSNLQSPFKFLSSYTSQDQGIFFGREQEEIGLYELLKGNRLVLVYGQSGTGKTSLVQCGLAKRYNAVGWYPLYIYRKENINESLLKALREAVDDFEVDNVLEIIEGMYLYYLRPVYLIFDQLEELLIIGKPEEQQKFINTIAQILAANLPCRILFVLREEYIAYLYGFEKVIPSLFDRRLRVEPMNRSNIENVILKSCAEFDITFENPAYNTGQIIDNLSSGRAGIQLPYLQVYLDMLWRDDFKRTYPEGTDSPMPPLEFTTRKIADFGKIDDVLEQFLNEQTIEIQSDIKKEFPKTENDLIKQLLDEFVTQEGTKRPIRYRMEGDTIYIEQSEVRLLNQLDPALRSYCLRRLEQSRLLTAREDTYELAHDTLAALIDQNRSEEQRRRNEAYNIVKNGYAVHKRTGEYLSRRQLLIIEEYLDEILPEKGDVLRQFVRDSIADADQKEQAERERQRRRTRNSYVIATIGTLLAVLAFIGFFNANTQKDNANTQKEEADTQRQKAINEKNTADSLLTLSESRLQSIIEANAREASVEVGRILEGVAKLEDRYPEVKRDMLDSAQAKLDKYKEIQLLDNLRDSVNLVKKQIQFKQ